MGMMWEGLYPDVFVVCFLFDTLKNSHLRLELSDDVHFCDFSYLCLLEYFLVDFGNVENCVR